MSFDGLSMVPVTQELQHLLRNGRVDRIHQPAIDSLIMSVHQPGDTYKLILSINPQQPRVHLTNVSWSNPPSPPAFCMLLRKHLEGNRVIDIIQQGQDRILSLQFEGRNMEGFYTVKHLYIELMGKYSNIILVENGMIIDSLRRVTSAMSRIREILPGKTYVLPIENKQSLLTVDEPLLTETLFMCSQSSLSRFLLQNYSGIGPQSAAEILARANLSESLRPQEMSYEQKSALATACMELAEYFNHRHYHPTVILSAADHGAIAALPYIPHQYKQKIQLVHFDTMNEALDHYYSVEHTNTLLPKQDMLKPLTTELARLQRKLSVQQQDLEQALQADQFRIMGDLLTANLHLLRKGQNQISVLNYYDDPPGMTAITLDPRLTPTQNVQVYYQRYAKLKRSQTITRDQMLQTQKDIEYIESLLHAIEQAEDRQQLAEVRDEIAQLLAPASKVKKYNTTANKPSQPMEFTASNGTSIHVGRNNRQNDFLTLKLARPHDIWLHTKDIPGSHVIIHTQGQPVSDDCIQQAAILAAFYSRAKYSSTVPVDYTYKRHVHKPAGAKPGMVIYDHQRTIYVTPNEQVVITLKKAPAISNH